MIKEAKNIDFYTSGKELSEQDFAHISKWIRKSKKKVIPTSKRHSLQKPTSPNKKGLLQFGLTVKSST